MMLSTKPFNQLYAQNSTIASLFSESSHYEMSENYEKAIEPLLSINAERSYDINMRLGWLNYLAGRYDEAVSYYDKAIKLKPKSIEARFGYVLPASELCYWGKIIEQYKLIILTDPINYFANFRLGLIYYNRKEYQTASEYFIRLYAHYSMDYDLVMMNAWCNLYLQKNKTARDFFYKALNIRPSDFWAKEGLKISQ